jgi:hypothetical protein
VVNTLNAYDGAWAALCCSEADAGSSSCGETERRTISQEEITEAIIGSIGNECNAHAPFHFHEFYTSNFFSFVGDVDSPQSPDQKGFTSLARFLNGASAADRQQWRDEILATSAADFKAFGERLASLSSADSSSAGVVVFGSESALNEANTQLPENKKLTLKKPFP